MTLKRLIVLLVVALLAAMLAACELSGSTPPPTVSGEGPMGTLQSELGNIATQTAAAGGGVPLVTTEPLPTLEGATAPPPAEGATQPAPTEAPAEPANTPTQEPPTAAPVTVSSPTPGIPSTYTLQKGEHPFCIARRFDVNQYELLNLNGLSLNSKPAVGFSLRLPPASSDFAGERTLQSHPDTYTVQAGDTIHSIACKYGDVSPEAIAQANGLNVSASLDAGQILQIP
ncbi:MAG TPA: LysM peptidoglycan-binding domain-containing protein [Anaerolineales bacterium]|jgi:LysM repeat protein